MKSLMIALMTVAPIFSFALSNPQIRICRTNGAEFLDVAISNDRLPFCNFGNALVGSQTLIDLQWYNKKTLALQAYAQNTYGSNCTNLGGRVDGSVVGAAAFGICKFEDGSYFELMTFERGVGAPENARMNTALGL